MPPENNDPMRALDGLLSDPEMLSKIQTIARQFSATSDMSADAPSPSRHHSTPPEADSLHAPPESPEVSMRRLPPVGPSFIQDEEYALLQALRPFLDDTKKNKLDHALRLLRLWQMAQGLKDYL